MPEYIVVCCYSCNLFQGQQQNKQKKFTCKVCGEKQSVRHIFGRSEYSKDIRPIVQELNKKRGEVNEGESLHTTLTESEFILPVQKELTIDSGKSQWTQFLPNKPISESVEKEEDSQFITDTSIINPSLRHERNKNIRNYKRSHYNHKQQSSLSEPVEIKKIEYSHDSIENKQNDSLYTTDPDRIEKEPAASATPQVSSNSIWSRFM